MSESKKVKCKLFFLPISGIILLSLAIFSHYFGNYEINANVIKNLQILPNSNAFKSFLSPPNLAFRKFYIFDVINADAVENGTEKPNLVERGPYAYHFRKFINNTESFQQANSLKYYYFNREIFSIENYEFVGDDYLKFTPASTFKFFPEYSNGTEYDELTVLNVPAIDLIEKTSKMNIKDADKLMNDIIKRTGSKLFVRKTVKQLISGYDDPLLTIANTVFPNLVTSKQFSLLFKAKNATGWQNFTIMTGIGDINNVGKIKLWNDIDVLTYWGSQYSNMINGTNGAFFHPFISKKENLHMFSTPMCRSLYLEFVKESYYNDHLKVYEFHLLRNIFANSTINPENYGFCENDKCLGNGVLNISSCSSGSPAFISQPHFLNADEKFVNMLVGLQPNDTLHDYIVQFEPTFGNTIQRNARIQINIYLSRFEQIDMVKIVNPVLFPLVWFDDVSELDNDSTEKLKTVENLINLTHLSIVIFSIAGAVLTLSSLIYLVNRYYKLRKEKNDSEFSKLLANQSMN